MLSLLVIDGFSPESPEGELVAKLAFQSSKFADILLVNQTTDQMLKKRWSVVWFCGHVTIHRKAHTATLDRREGRSYRVITQAAHVAQAACSLLVLSGCHTDRLVVRSDARASNVITYSGKLYLHDSLVFASSFMWLLRQNTSPHRVTRSAVRYAFAEASAVTGAGRYRLHEQ